jgi:hypothetical protein
MNGKQLEDWYIRSMHQPMSEAEKREFEAELINHPEVRNTLTMHDTLREVLIAKGLSTFGPYFSGKVMQQIERTGVVIDHYIFLFFKRFQLAAIGVVVALFILNVLLADQPSMVSILGLDRTTVPEEEIMTFDFYEILNEGL